MTDGFGMPGTPGTPDDRATFDSDLAAAVATATRDAHLAQPGEVIRIGRRRARARRGGAAIVVVAVLGVVYGVAGIGARGPGTGTPTGPGPAGPVRPTTSARSQPSEGGGVLPASQWPGLDHARSTPYEEPIKPLDPNGFPVAVSHGCDGPTQQDLDNAPRGKMRSWGIMSRGTAAGPTGKFDQHEDVYTFPDEASARQAFANARAAATQEPCYGTVIAGVTTADEQSYVQKTSQPVNDGSSRTNLHIYLVVEGKRLAQFAVSSVGTESTSGDAAVLAEIRAALVADASLDGPPVH